MLGYFGMKMHENRYWNNTCEFSMNTYISHNIKTADTWNEQAWLYSYKEVFWWETLRPVIHLDVTLS